MAALKEQVKLFIVQALACFDTPSVVVESVKEEFGIVVTRFQVIAYDPTKANGQRLSKKWVDEFHKVREEFRVKTEEIAISNKASRLRRLDRMSNKAESKNNIPLAAALIEQAAKEMGEAYVNRHREPPKAPGDSNTVPQSEYVLKPDEPSPAKPIL